MTITIKKCLLRYDFDYLFWWGGWESGLGKRNRSGTEVEETSCKVEMREGKLGVEEDGKEV